MKYFLFTDRIETFKKPIFGKPVYFFDLISIAIVCEDGRQYSALNMDYFQPHSYNLSYRKSKNKMAGEIIAFVKNESSYPQFYSWVANYDWVLLCSIFGGKEYIPNCFPEYCYNVQQDFDVLQYKSPALQGIMDEKDESIFGSHSVEIAEWTKRMYLTIEKEKSLQQNPVLSRQP